MSWYGFGEVVMLHLLCLGHPCQYYGYLNPTSMESRIWGDRIGNLPVRCWRFKACVQCDAGSLWLVIIPRSNDRFMERPSMKTVQP
jgi:hypothetical protein